MSLLAAAGTLVVGRRRRLRPDYDRRRGIRFRRPEKPRAKTNIEDIERIRLAEPSDVITSPFYGLGNAGEEASEKEWPDVSANSIGRLEMRFPTFNYNSQNTANNLIGRSRYYLLPSEGAPEQVKINVTCRQ
jgi:hypothetical protein